MTGANKRSVKWDALATTGDDENKDWLQASGAQQIKWSETPEVVIRPIGPILFMARHWPKSLMSGKNTPPIWCPKYNPLTNKFEDDRQCVMHDDFKDNWKAQKTIIFAAIVRDWQADGSTPRKNPIAVMTFSWQAKDLLNKIVAINKFDISDPEKGCDISITYNAAAKGNTPRYLMMRTDRTPLTDAEKAMVDGTGKVKMPDLDKISPDFGDVEFTTEYNQQMKAKLAMFAYYVSRKDEDVAGEGWDGFKKDVNGKPYTKFAELIGLVDDGSKKTNDKPKRRRDEDDDDAPPARNKPPRDDDDADPELQRRRVVDDDAPAPKRNKPRDDDEGSGDDDPEPEAKKPAKTPPPEPKPAAAAKKPSKAPPPPEDDDGDADGGDDDDDPPEAEAKKPVKAPSKAPLAATSRNVIADDDDPEPPKKPNRKPPPPDEDDEDGDDPAAKVAARAKAKDEDAEPPFVPDEKPKKKAAPRPGFEDWAEEFNIVWKVGDSGKSVPTCFPVFEDEDKCKGCVVRKACSAQKA